MISFIYAIRDLRDDSYDQIWNCAGDPAAIRMTKATMRDERSPLSMFKEDFALMCLGQIDLKTGIVTSSIRHICDLVNIEGVYENV